MIKNLWKGNERAKGSSKEGDSIGIINGSLKIDKRLTYC